LITAVDRKTRPD